MKVVFEVEEGSLLPKEVPTSGLTIRCDPNLGGFTFRKKDGTEIAEGQFNLERFGLKG